MATSDAPAMLMSGRARADLALPLVLILIAGGLVYEAEVAAVEAGAELQGQLDDLREQVRTLAELTLGGEGRRGSLVGDGDVDDT